MTKDLNYTCNLFPFEKGEDRGSLCFEYLPCINYSIYHNHTPTCLKCTLTNQSEGTWKEVVVGISGPEIQPQETTIEQLLPEQEMALKELALVPIVSRLLDLTEPITTQFQLRISQNGEVIFEKDFPLYLMAYDQWCGLTIRPELLAAFVTPNQPLLSRVITHAAAHLERFSGSSSFDEYQTRNPNRVRMQVAALFEALREEGLIYASVPPSFEDYGQRIRLADKVLNEKLGTCMDLTLLFASCLEAVGIHPLLVLMKGHIFVGAWLVDSIYATAVSDDVSFLRKESSDGINEMVFVESTCMASSSTLSFDDAADTAKRNLLDEENFNLFIDVCRARMDKVRPLPQRIQKEGNWEIVNEGEEHDLGTTKVNEYHHYDIKIEEKDEEVTKQTLWERKLLDFTLRNNLLNMKIGKKVIPFISFSIDKLEDYIQAGEHYQILPSPLNQDIAPEATGIYNSALYKQELEDFILKDLADKKLHAYLNETELTEAVKHLYRESRTAMEENGANTLFLVLGVLKWLESPQSERPRFAPLLLLPVELVRNGGCKKYVLRARDEEMILNITLVELLKQKYEVLLNGLSPLPKDESGVDVKKIFSIIRTCILKEKGWDVIEESMLGLFSFNKFVMWNDIHSNADKLKENEIIQSLMENRLVCNDNCEEMDIHQVDNEVSPKDYALPVAADSSQLEAVLQAGEGKSFILHGPPGTGKSQTITNIIANALYQGKRVLFVAEKMAALSVVQNRLERIGLEPFCLELHSNKVNKKHFLEQLDQALNTTRLTSPEDFAQKAEELFQQRKALITYMQKLHQIEDNGFSLYDCINQYLSYTEEELPIPLEQLSTIDKETLQQDLEEVANLDTIFEIIGNPRQHPLNGLYPKNNAIETKEGLKRLLPDYKEGITVLPEMNRFMTSTLGAEVPLTSEGVRVAQEVMSVLQQLPRYTSDLVNFCSDETNIDRLKHLVDLGEKGEQLKTEILGTCSLEFLQEEGASLKREWEEIQQKWFLPKFFSTRKFVKKIQTYSPQTNGEEIPALLQQLADYQDKRRQIREGHLNDILGDMALPEREDWKAIATTAHEMPRLLIALKQLAQLQEKDLLQMLGTLNQNVNGQWAIFKQSKEQSLHRLLTETEGLLNTDQELKGFAYIENRDAPEAFPDTATVENWIAHLDALRDWQHWCLRKESLEQRGLGAVIEHLLDHKIPSATAARQLGKTVFHLLATRRVDTDPYLNQFNGLLFEKQIEKYQQMAQQFQELTRKELYCKLASKIPAMSMEAAASSEIGILKKNINNGGRGTSIRKIMDMTPHLLPQLCPCMLMSPISVAQYIDLDQNKFDLVVFDEASQMPTSEAVGAIARGKSLIVVGDPKQMPPTSFFASNKVEEEEAYIDDLDSILDDCIALSLPSRYLTWHYRSKHESLIAFSNSQYYDGKLFTFPSTDDRASKVRLIPVEGTYDKGKTRSNRAEAQAIVEEVIRRLSDEKLCKRSMGIVAFSSVQQNLIEDLLTDALSQNADLEQKALLAEEPIFIKNLENVQGDERDVILFSIGYGPDKNGKVSMNFGPLNNKGGERRLNVAVSRARYEMLIFSTLKSEQIDLRRTNALGVEGLKNFLEFAERGTISVPSEHRKVQDNTALIEDIAHELRLLNYQVDTKVGRSNFKVDLAVLSPQDENKYMLGILCDGRDFYESNTIRDRAIVQPSVLKLLDWNILRIWSVDWLERKEAVLAKIQTAIQKIESAETSPQEEPEVEKKISCFKEELKNMQPVEKVNLKEKNYSFAKIATCSHEYTIDKLLEKEEKISEQIQKMMETEQPITNTLIYKRIVQLWKQSRNTPRIQAMIDHILEKFYTDPYSCNGTKTYWISEADFLHYEGYRVNSNRDVLDIPIIEMMNAMTYVVEQQISIPKEDCKRITSQILGFSHLGSNIDMATEKALSNLLELQILQLQDGKVSLMQA